MSNRNQHVSIGMILFGIIAIFCSAIALLLGIPLALAGSRPIRGQGRW